ncbi:MAG TPA: hypothetical protein VGZ29_16230 [Terriglobia bacterium]|nr:hypothetical protein [Terriglobia bacterium]
MSDHMYNLLSGIYLHLHHPGAMLAMGIVVLAWVLVSLPAGLLIGRALRVHSHKRELPREITGAPLEPAVMSTPGRVA